MSKPIAEQACDDFKSQAPILTLDEASNRAAAMHLKYTLEESQILIAKPNAGSTPNSNTHIYSATHGDRTFYCSVWIKSEDEK